MTSLLNPVTVIGMIGAAGTAAGATSTAETTKAPKPAPRRRFTNIYFPFVPEPRWDPEELLRKGSRAIQQTRSQRFSDGPPESEARESWRKPATSTAVDAECTGPMLPDACAVSDRMRGRCA